jgi:threonine/homoserine/homoserine lactone efflux protein
MSFVIAAITFGLVAGINPGPLGVFVIHQTMSKGYLHGLVASLTPVLTDLPILVVVALLTLQLGELDWFVASISFIGASYLAWVARRMFNSSDRVDPSLIEAPKVDWLTGVKMNFLNPVPYIFWGTVGGTYIASGTAFEASIFVITMLVVLCTTKFCVAIAFVTLGGKFSSKIYSRIMKSLAVPMLFFSGALLVRGIQVIL